MRSSLFRALAVLCLVSGSVGKKGFGPGEQEWGFVEVRPSAHMFWWLYYTTADVDSYYEKPLVIWLQGGPGGSSTSFGNFEELGPLDTNLQPRNYTWVKDYNVLFIDNPVGTGYSYVKNDLAFATTNDQIAHDLISCMRGFYKELPKFENVPTYITTESYGGKMGAEFALIWYKFQKAGNIKSNLKGVALGDAWISPIDSVLTWAPFLLNTGMIDTKGFENINKAAKTVEEAVKTQQWYAATSYWAYTQNVVMQYSYNVDFYNILTKIHNEFNTVRRREDVSSFDAATIYRNFVDLRSFSLDQLMNGPVKSALGVETTHGSQSTSVFQHLQTDFMKPVTAVVEQLLSDTNLTVFVYTGHMDLIVDTPGTLQWVEKLKWEKAASWKNAIRYPLIANSIVEGYMKAQDNFRMYWINRAGHMVPKDNPAAMEVILQDLTDPFV